MTLPVALTNAVSPEAAVGVLMTVTGLALLIAAGLLVALLRQSRNTHRQNARLEAAHMEVVRLRRILATQPPPRRPAPEQQTRPMPRPSTADTQRIPAHQPPTRTARHGDAT